MSAPVVTGADPSVVGVSDRDLNRTVASFFAAHPFGGNDDSFEKLATEAFFRRFLGGPESSEPSAPPVSEVHAGR